MKLTLSLISNRPQDVLAMIETIPKGLHPISMEDIHIALAYQSPLDQLLGQIETRCHELGIHNFDSVKGEFRKNGLFHYGQARSESWKLARGEYVLICDDDFRFGTGTKTAKFTSGERLIDAMNFIDNQNDKIIIQLTTFFGSVGKHREFWPISKNSLWATDRGIFLKNHGFDLIHPNVLLPGAGEDVAIFATHLAMGYQAFKGFKAITNKAPSKVLYTSRNPNYDYDAVVTNGVIGAIRKHYPWFHLDRRLLDRPAS